MSQPFRTIDDAFDDPDLDQPPVVTCDGLVKIYKVADLEVVALQGLDLVVEAGEFVAVIGASGSGKSTLLRILGGLETPSAGTVQVGGHDLLHMGARQRTSYRRSVAGFVWQQTARNLMPYLSASENVQFPMMLRRGGRRDRQAQAVRLLGLVGLADRAEHRPAELSGGEQQRVAIAVALANNPAILFADEPTGELDSATASEIFALLRHVNEERGVTVIAVTHDPQVADHVRRTVAIRDGRVASEVLRRDSGAGAAGGPLIAEEFAVLDRVGRLQLPEDYIDALALSQRVRLTLDPDHISVFPDRQSASGTDEEAPDED